MKTFNDFEADKSFAAKKLVEADKNSSVPSRTTWTNWKKSVNMTAKEVKAFHESAGVKDETLHTMLSIGKTFLAAEKQWSPQMWRSAEKQILAISKLQETRKKLTGNPFFKDDAKTPWYQKMLMFGNDPRKV